MRPLFATNDGCPSVIARSIVGRSARTSSSAVGPPRCDLERGARERRRDLLQVHREQLVGDPEQRLQLEDERLRVEGAGSPSTSRCEGGLVDDPVLEPARPRAEPVLDVVAGVTTEPPASATGRGEQALVRNSAIALATRWRWAAAMPGSEVEAAGVMRVPRPVAAEGGGGEVVARAHREVGRACAWAPSGIVDLAQHAEAGRAFLRRDALVAHVRLDDDPLRAELVEAPAHDGGEHRIGQPVPGVAVGRGDEHVHAEVAGRASGMPRAARAAGS